MSGRHLLDLVIRFVCLTAAALFAATSVVVLIEPDRAAAADSVPVPPAATVRISDTAITPARVVIVPGQTVIIENTTQAPVEVEASDGSFDSGPIAPGGAFVAAIDSSSPIDFVTTGTERRGQIVFGLGQLPGTATALARTNLPALEPPATDAGDLGPHPVYGYPTSRTQMLVLLQPTTTIAQANTLLADPALGLTVIGSLPLLQILVVSVNDPGDHSNVIATLAALRARTDVVAAASPVWQGDTEIEPRRPDLAVRSWGSDAIRAPAAWNLLDAAREQRDSGTRVDTVALDNMFDTTHPDLRWASVDPTNAPSDNHGSHVAGIIGATFDNTRAGFPTFSRGTFGVNPMARLHGMSYGPRTPLAGGSSQAYTVANFAAAFNNVLGEKRAGGRVPDLRVVNASFGVAVLSDPDVVASWVQRLSTVTCGPGFGDDLSATTRVPCLPGNEDTFQTDLRAVATIYAGQVLETAAAPARNVVIVKSAGNAHDAFCQNTAAGATVTVVACGKPPAGAVVGPVVPTAAADTNEFIVARAQRVAASKPSPVLVVEAVDASDALASYSQRGGDVAAPGDGILATTTAADPGGNPLVDVDGTHTYGELSGTSMATPHVTGALGYLFALQPNLSATAAVAEVIASARAKPGEASRLDLFALVTRSGGVRRLADLNDPSSDGNRRVVYDDRGNRVGLDQATAATTDGLEADLGARRSDPDGKVDLRDVRRFRDLWLQSCIDGSGGGVPGALTCPSLVSIDGNPASHPKFDANHDGCFRPSPTVNTGCRYEVFSSRGDLNGDGSLAVNTPAPVHATATGGPAATTTPMTDFEVLRAALDRSPATLDGWPVSGLVGATAATSDLARLMVSADIDVRLRGFSAAVTNLTIVVDYGTGQLTVPVTRPAGTSDVDRVFTVPVKPDGTSTIAVWATGTLSGQPIRSVTQRFTEQADVAAGADTVARLCPNRLNVVAAQGVLVPGAATTLTAGSGCPGETSFTGELNAGAAVTFAVASTDGGAPTIAGGATTVDATGRATAQLTAGLDPGTYTVTATMTPTSGPAQTATTTVRVVPSIQVRYRWESEVTGVSQTGTTDWPDSVPGRPDCTEIPTLDACVTEAATALTPGSANPVLDRVGTLTLTTDGVRLDETISGSQGSVTTTYTLREPNGTTSDGTKTFTFEPTGTSSVSGRLVPVTLAIAPDGAVTVDGFRFLAEIGYPTSVVESTSGSAADPLVLGIAGELLPLSVPATDGIQHTADPAAVTRLTPASGGGFTPVTWCGAPTQRFTREAGYRLPQSNPLLPGATPLGLDRSYDPGDLPMPVGSGRIDRRIRVAFTAAVGANAPDPTLPTCAGAAAPTAAIDWVTPPDGLIEGRAIQFLDRSTDADDDIRSWAWTFSDGGTTTYTSSARDPLLLQGLDASTRNGDWTVTLRVTDTGGRSSRTTRLIRVENTPPRIAALQPVVAVADGQPASVDVTIDDDGPVSRKRLWVYAYRNQTIIHSARYAAGQLTIPLGTLPVGVHDVRVQVTDDFGGTSTNVTVQVLPDPPPPTERPELPPVLASSCAATTPLTAAEAELLDRWNDARERAGLPALALSPELTRAAVSIAGDSLGVLGIAPAVDVGTAIADAGYAGRTGTRALPYGRDDHPASVLEALRVSEPNTVLSPTARMAGVSFRSDGPDVKWIAVVGEVLDCDVTVPGPGTPPTVTVTPPGAPVAEGSPVTLDVAISDPDDDVAEVRVNWGDGTVSSTEHRYLDDGTYDITVRVADEQGNVTVEGPFPVTVLPVAPEVSVAVSPIVDDGTGALVGTLEVAAADVAERDRPLRLQVSSVPVGVVTYDGTIEGGRTFRVAPPAGTTEIELTATVTDPDGLSTTDTTGPTPVPGTPPTAPPNVTLQAPACAGDQTVALRAQAADFLTGSNAFRVASGRTPLVVSPELQRAAQAHLTDLIDRQYFDHVSPSGSTPLDRVRAANPAYRGGVGENIALRFVSGEQALLGFRSSPVHLDNLLDPIWTATGIAAGNGPNGVLWVQVFGTDATCPATAVAGLTPQVLANPPLDRAAPVAGWSHDRNTAAPAIGTTPAQVGTVVSQATPPTTDAVVTAFTVDRLHPAAGEVVTIVNRSRVAGVPVSATLTFGPLAARTLAPDGQFARGVYSNQLATLATAGLSAIVEFTASGVYEPQVTIVAPSNGSTVDQGAIVAVRATVRDANGDAIAGVRVRVTETTLTAPVPVFAVTDAAGTAIVDVRVAGSGGVTLTVEAERTDGTFASAQIVTLTAAANQAPIVDAGGPYALEANTPLVLAPPDASDADDNVVAYAWDLDGDGQFDDLATKDATVPWSTVTALVCGGVCSIDEVATIRLRATDSRGASGDDEATVTIVSGFGLAVTPQSLSLPPGTSTTLRVDVLSVSGFTGNVALTAGTLPTGITATFSPTSVKPGSSATMTVTVASGVTISGAIDLPVVGTATVPGLGTVQRTASPTVSVLFGLQPTCTVGWSGQIVDAATGAGIRGTIRISSGSNIATDANGYWVAPAVALGTNNAPRFHSVEATAFGRHGQSITRTAVCGVPLDDVDIALHPVQTVTVSARIHDSANSTLVPGQARIDIGDLFTGSSSSRSVDTDGRTTFTVALRGPDNQPTAIRLTGSAPGFHPFSADRSISAADIAAGVAVDLPIVRICSASFTGGVVVDPDGRRVPGARVSFGNATVTTDDQGEFTFSPARAVAMAAPRNGDVQITPTATPPLDRPDLIGSGTTVRVSGCQPFEAELRLGFNPAGVPRYGSIVVRVTDPDGTPIADANVAVGGAPANLRTGADGTARFEQVLVGYVNPENGAEPTPVSRGAYVTAGPVDSNSQYTQWWPRSSDQVQLAAGANETIDVVLDPVRMGTVGGTAVDAVTGEVLQGVNVQLTALDFRTAVSGADGRYTFQPIRLAQTGPTRVNLGSITTSTHWGNAVTAPDVPGDPPQLDLTLPMIRKCEAAQVVGRVVSNDNQAPIAGATIDGYYASTTTNANGEFTLLLPPERDNVPYPVLLAASAPGFNTATRRISIFCGARLVVDFAPPSTFGPGTVQGVVRDAAGAVAPGIFVGTSWGGSATTDANGAYSIGGAPSSFDGTPRTWTVTALPPSASQQLAASATFSLPAAETVTQDLTLGERDPDPPANRAPVAVITPPSPETTEGAAITLSATGSSDPDGDPLTFAWDLDGDGFDDGGAATISVLLPRPTSQQVRLLVSDGRGLTNIATTTVVAANVAPTVDVGSDIVIGTDGVLTRPGLRFLDPGDGDTFTLTVDWGEGAGEQALTRSGRNFELIHAFAGPGAYTVLVTVCDESGACGSDGFTVTVPVAGNRPPVATISAPSTIAEGGTIRLDASGSNDPDGDPLTFAWDTDLDGSFDDGSAAVVEFPAGSPGTRTPIVRVTDTSGASSAASAVVEVSNVAPLLDAIANVATTVGATLSTSTVVRDLTRAPRYTATVDWGDGSGPTPIDVTPTTSALTASNLDAGPMAVGTVLLTHAYGAPGTYPATLSVCDTGCSQVTFNVTVAAGAAPTTDLVTSIVWSGRATPGGTATATITVRNAGPTTATPQVSLSIPAGTSVVSLGGPGWVCTDEQRCTLSSPLAVGESSSFTSVLSLSPTIAGELQLVATTASTVSEVEPADNVARATISVDAPAPSPTDLLPATGRGVRIAWGAVGLLIAGLALRLGARRPTRTSR